MATGYLVTLGDGSLDTSDSISGAQSTFTIDSTIGTGQWTWDGVWDNDGQFYSNVLDTGTYSLGTDGNVYFIPDNFFTTSGTATVTSAPVFTASGGTVDGTGGDDTMGVNFVDAQGNTIDGADGNDDIIYGFGGNDSIHAGDGDDTVYGGSSNPNLITNASFEDGTHTANGVNGLTGWSNVNGSPDSADDGAAAESWNPANAASDGTGYITMWASSTGPNESMQQTLATPLQAGTTYTFSLDAISADYVGTTWFTPTDIPVSFEILDAATGTVLGSVTVQSTTYETYEFDITPTTNVSTIIIRPNTTGTGSNPSVIIDNISLVESSSSDDDTIDGGAGDDILYGDAGHDSIIGGTGSDSLYGGDGHDTLEGGANADYLEGGAGQDTADYSNSGSAVNVNLTTNVGTGGDAQGDTYAGIDGVIGSDFNDTIVGYDGQSTDPIIGYTNIFYGGAGDDYLDALGGNDTLYGGDGADQIIDGAGDDTAYGGEGKDRFDYTTITGNDSVVGGEVNDTTATDSGDKLDAHNSIDNLTVTFTGDEAGTMNDGSGIVTFSEIEHIQGGQGADTIDASASTVGQILDGGENADTIQGGSGDDIIALGQTQDFSATDGDDDTLILVDGFGNDSIEGFEVPDDLGGGSYSGNDQVNVTGLNDAGGSPVDTNDVTVTDTNGDGTGDAILTFPNGESITLWGVTTSQVSSPAQLEAIGIPLAAPSSISIHDAIELGGSAPSASDVLTTAAGDLVEIDEPLTFTTASSGQIAVGDTVTIDGTLYTVSASSTIEAFVTHSDGLGGTTVTGVKAYGLTLDDGSGGTIDYILPTDDMGNLPEITQITIDSVNLDTKIDPADVDANEIVTLASIADGTVHGTAGNDTMSVGFVDAQGDTIDGADGLNDIIEAGDGDDAVRAGQGNDTVYGGLGADTLYGQAGDDTMFGGDNNDLLYGGEGTNTLDGGIGDDYIASGTGDDSISGGAGQDDVDAGAGNDTVYGGSELDNIDGDAGNDLIYGGTGGDQLYGGADNDTIYGEAGGDAIYAGTGVDSIDGGASADYIQLTSGNDVADGGDDQDNIDIIAGAYTDGAIVTVDGGTGGIDSDTLDLDSWAAYRNLTQTADADADSFSGSIEVQDASGNWITVNFTEIETFYLPSTDLTPNYIVEGTAAGELINVAYTGDPEGDMVDANDNLAGNNDDVIHAGGGSDTVVAGDGNDTVLGEGGADSIYGNAGNDVLQGDAGNDSLWGETGTDTLYGGTGEDFLAGGANNDVLYGGDNDDILAGEAGDDTLTGGSGDDVLLGETGADTIYGGDGNDSIALEDNFGNDTIEGGEGAETFGDLLNLATLTTDTTIDLSGSDPEAGSVTSGASTATFTEIESINLGGGRDTIVLADGSGADTVNGFDTADSGDGTTNDQLDVSGMTSDGGTTPVTANDVVVTDNGSGDAVLTFPGGESITLLGVAPTEVDSIAELIAIGIPNGSDGTVHGTAGGDLIDNSFVDAQNDSIDGADGLDDIVVAGAGDDNIDAGAGNDTIFGGSGDDTIFLDNTLQNDTVDGGSTGETLGDHINLSSFSTGVTVNLTAPETGTITDGTNTTQFSEIENITTGSGDDTVDGSGGSENLILGAGNDTVNAGGGNDTILAGTGNDTIDGGAGDDNINAGTGADIVSGGTGNDTINVGAADGNVDTVSLADGDGNDTVSGFEAPVDNGDGTFTGQDQVNVSGLNDANGHPVNTADVTVTDTNGNGTGDAILTFPNGESIQLNGILPSAVATPDQLEAIGIPLAPIVTIHDAIELGGAAPSNGDVLTTLAGDLVEVDEPVAFTTSVAAQIQAGDTTVIGGVTYTVVSVTSIEANVTHSDGAGGSTTTLIKAHGLNLDDGSGGTLSYIIPVDPSGALPEITQIELTAAPDPATNIDAVDVDADDNVTLSPADGTVHGTAGNDVMNPGFVDAQGDTIDGADGDNDIIVSGDGDDDINAGNGSDTVYAGSGDDEIYAGFDTSNDTIFGGSGDDSMWGFEGNDELHGGDDNDHVDGDEGNDTLYGGAGDDVLIGDTGTDIIYGGVESDTLYAGADNDELFGGSGADTLYGDTGSDTLDGGDGADVINAGDDADTITASSGDDTVHGGTGTDTFDLTGSTAPQTVDVQVNDNGNGSSTLTPSGDTTDLTSVENFVASETNGGIDTITLTTTALATDVTDISDAAIGIFTPTNGDPAVSFGGAGEPTINEILDKSAGIFPGGTFVITSGDEEGTVGEIHFDGFETINISVVCFAKGTHIRTNKGQVLIEDLVEGDKVVTRDHGQQKIRWIGSSKVRAKNHLAPIMIKAGALNNVADLRVSPQHRMLIEGQKAEILFGEREVLVAAKHLINDHNIYVEETEEVEYFHILFDTHEVIYAEGAPSESFHPGEEGMSALDQDLRDEIHEIFPVLQYNRNAFGPSARRALSMHEAILLM